MTRVTVALVVRAAVEFFEISKVDLLSRRRANNISLARQTAFWAARVLTGKSLPQLGRCFGRDHSTILHAIKSIEAARKADTNVRDITDDFLVVVEASARALEKLDTGRTREIDGLAVAEAILDNPMKVTTASVDELHALAATALHLAGQAAHADLHGAKNIAEQNMLCHGAISSVLDASRAFECARYSAGERAALEDLCSKLGNLRNAFEHPQGGQK